MRWDYIRNVWRSVGHFHTRSPTGSTQPLNSAAAAVGRTSRFDTFQPTMPRAPAATAAMACVRGRGVCTSLLVVVLAVALLADCTLAQTFSYSRGWKSGKRATAAAVPGGPVASPGNLGGRTTDDILAEDLPLYRYLLEGRGEHRVPYDPWRLAEVPVVHFARRPALPQGEDQPGLNEHDDR